MRIRTFTPQRWASDVARFGAANGPSCGRCADFPTPESCYRTKDAPADPNRAWASAQSCIQRCHNGGRVPLDCRYLGTRDYPSVVAQFGGCEGYYEVAPGTAVAPAGASWALVRRPRFAVAARSLQLRASGDTVPAVSHRWRGMPTLPVIPVGSRRSWRRLHCGLVLGLPCLWLRQSRARPCQRWGRDAPRPLALFGRQVGRAKGAVHVVLPALRRHRRCSWGSRRRSGPARATGAARAPTLSTARRCGTPG